MIENYLPDGRFVKTSEGGLAYFLGRDNNGNDIFLMPVREDDEIFIKIYGGKLFKNRDNLILYSWWSYKSSDDEFNPRGFSNNPRGFSKIIEELKLAEENRLKK